MGCAGLGLIERFPGGQGSAGNLLYLYEKAQQQELLMKKRYQ